MKPIPSSVEQVKINLIVLEKQYQNQLDIIKEKFEKDLEENQRHLKILESLANMSLSPTLPVKPIKVLSATENKQRRKRDDDEEDAEEKYSNFIIRENDNDDDGCTAETCERPDIFSPKTRKKRKTRHVVPENGRKRLAIVLQSCIMISRRIASGGFIIGLGQENENLPWYAKARISSVNIHANSSKFLELGIEYPICKTPREMKSRGKIPLYALSTLEVAEREILFQSGKHYSLKNPQTFEHLQFKSARSGYVSCRHIDRLYEFDAHCWQPAGRSCACLGRSENTL